MSSPSQKQRVEALEGACHRALAPDAADDFPRQALLVALVGDEPVPDGGAPPIVVGLSNMVWAHSLSLLQALKRGKSPQQRRVLVHDLCAALHELHEAL